MLVYVISMMKLCDKHDEDDDKSDEMVGSHERFSDDENKKLISLRKPWIKEISLRLRGSLDKEMLLGWEGGHSLVWLKNEFKRICCCMRSTKGNYMIEESSFKDSVDCPTMISWEATSSCLEDLKGLYLIMYIWKYIIDWGCVCIGESLEGFDNMIVTNQFDWERLVILDLLDEGVLRLCE